METKLQGSKPLKRKHANSIASQPKKTKYGYTLPDFENGMKIPSGRLVREKSFDSESSKRLMSASWKQRTDALIATQNDNNLSKYAENYVMKDDLLDKNTESLQRKVSAKKQKKINRIKNKKANSLPAKHPDAEIRTIYVGNVNCEVNKKTLVKYFSKYGEIETVRIRGIAAESLNISKKEAVTQKKYHPERHTVVAYIRFKDKISQEKALNANGEVFEGLHLRVDNAEPTPVKNKNSVFIGNLAFEAEDEDLWNFFQDCGEIDSVRIVRSSKTGAGKGFGFVTFKAKDSVEMALRFNGRTVKNRELRVKRVSKKEKEEKKPIIKRKKSSVASLVNSQKSRNKMNLKFLKHDKPQVKRSTNKDERKRKHMKDKITTNFVGAKTSEDGKLVRRKRKPRKLRAEKKKMALAKILAAKTKTEIR